MPGAAVIGAASLGSALIGSNAAQNAAKLQARSAAQARTDMLPFMYPGQGAAARLANLYGIDPTTGAQTGQAFNPAALQDFRNSPDYQFAMNEGLRGVENSMAGKGLLKSGSTVRGLADYAAGLATQTLGNYRGALQQLAQLGAGAAGGAGSAAMQGGTALASGQIGAANAQTGALGSFGNYFMLQNLLKPGQSVYGGGGQGGGGMGGGGGGGVGGVFGMGLPTGSLGNFAY